MKRPLGCYAKRRTIMNFDMKYLPIRPAKPRETGLTMVMDKGLSLGQARDFVEMNAELVDIVKLGFGTSMVTANLKEKIKIYQDAGLEVYFGGTLFEAFYVRNQLAEFRQMCLDNGIKMVEVSDGSIVLNHKKKCELITSFAQEFKVLSEVGSKEEGILISPAKWIRMMLAELKAGSWKVIAEARESGNVGIFRPNGSAHTILINKIMAKVNNDNILWEAPKKPQQVWFLKLMGPNVNLGNIAPNDVIPLETLRLGLRGDTFFEHLPEAIVKNCQPIVPEPSPAKKAKAKPAAKKAAPKAAAKKAEDAPKAKA